MNIEYIIKSPCKINLHLDVHNKREDGYHALTSIFQLISLEDTIHARLNNSGEISIDGTFDCKLEDNLIYKAAKKFFDKAKLNIGINFKVDKKVHAGGGIGGGSGNCGAVLRLLKTVFPNKVSNEELFDIALSLGSDVPFFLKSPTALVQGRGEIITPLETHNKYYILLCNPSVHISTRDAFSKLKEKGVLTPQNDVVTKRIMEMYSGGVKNFIKFKNSFEIALYSDYNFIQDIKTTMINGGAIFSGLSGSGSTMFGVFTEKSAAIETMSVLSKNDTYKIDIVKPLDKFPDVIKRDF